MQQHAANYFDALAYRALGTRETSAAPVVRVANAYLDGKPESIGRKKLTRRERDSLFWASDVVACCPPESWSEEAMLLALARYLAQDAVTAQGLIVRVAREAPEVLARAVRYSALALRPHSPRRAELDLAAEASETVTDLCRVLGMLDAAHRERVAALEVQKAKLTGLSVFDLLIYASLYAFEALVPTSFSPTAPAGRAAAGVQQAWDAINDLVAWKLSSASIPSLNLSDDCIGSALAKHLRPILFEPGMESSSDAARNLHAFHELVAAQIELNEFTIRSVDAFCFDDGIRFERRGTRLEIVEVDPAARSAWQRSGLKLDRLHEYWFNRAIETYIQQVACDPAKWTMGRPENAELNRMAWLRALQAQLQLREAYGVDDELKSDSGLAVDLFGALLSLSLMSAFFQRDFLGAYAERLNSSRDWIVALRCLAIDGLREGMQNRLPVTWSSRDSKVSNITGWTLTPSTPQGSPRMASAIVDFWTYDITAMAKLIQGREPGLQPHLFERPVLKFGKTLVQLPWIVGMQNISSAAINNLRRLGARRGQARDEAHRIEAGLAGLLEARGFRTVLNWKPARGMDGPGEVDLIAMLGQHLFVIEVKSTFLRRSQRDTWLHATNTLRKAGHQLLRKVEAVSLAVAADQDLRAMLGLAGDHAPPSVHGWIADTSIECDHQRFSGFLKVSIEELLISLRDESHLLIRANRLAESVEERLPSSSVLDNRWTLYPNGFGVERFVEVIETEAVWSILEESGIC
jgi:Holliday junction resolvase-like predicted endonuclease